MPRPGPRPYECVRRAWHSDRHQPMRGSIISQILRVVTEAHSPATRKNREWQEKLPIVVFKAEEILYSKANSEAEYINPDTLWDRLNDAVDTIIRKEEGTETGECLQPCIEAALVLGCVPVKASRSQRHSNPRSYLHHRGQEPAPRASAVLNQPISPRPPPQTSISPSNQLGRLAVGSLPNAVSNLDNRTSQSNTHITVNNAPLMRRNFEHGIMPTLPIDSGHSLKVGSVHPLYYGTDLQNLKFQSGPHLAHNQNPSNVIFGRPICWSSSQPTQQGTIRDLFPSVGAASASDRSRQSNPVVSCGIASEVNCDLSLRLGRSSEDSNVERHLQHEHEAGGSGRCLNDARATQSSSWSPEFCFLPRQSSDDPLEPSFSRRANRAEVLDANATVRKRKMPFFHDANDGSTSQQPDCSPNQFPGRTRWPGFQ